VLCRTCFQKHGKLVETPAAEPSATPG
jgi:hypothetical protein